MRDYPQTVTARFVGGPWAGEVRVMEELGLLEVLAAPPLSSLTSFDPHAEPTKVQTETYRYIRSPEFCVPGASRPVVFYYPTGLSWQDVVYEAMLNLATTTASHNALEKSRYA